jgi:hypothetical protein
MSNAPSIINIIKERTIKLSGSLAIEKLKTPVARRRNKLLNMTRRKERIIKLLTNKEEVSAFPSYFFLIIANKIHNVTANNEYMTY